MFNSVVNGSGWFEDMIHFLHWCDKERRKCVPKGICGQSMHITSGQAGFDAKYPTFEGAYAEYMKSFEAAGDQ